MYSSIHSQLVSVSVVAVNRADVHFDSLTTCLCDEVHFQLELP
jgi:hypothetical protein